MLKIDYSDPTVDYDAHKNAFKLLNLANRSISGIINCCGTSHVSKFSDMTSSEVERVKITNMKSLEICLQTLHTDWIC